MPLTCPRWDDMPSAAMPSRFGILFLRVKTGTGFVGEATVTIDLSIGIAFFEYGEQLVEGFLLLWRARVSRMALDVEATDVAHTDAMGVMPTTMRAHTVVKSASIDRPVQVNHIMIAYALPSSRLVPTVDVVDGHLHSWRCGGTMDDDGVDAASVIGQNCFERHQGQAGHQYAPDKGIPDGLFLNLLHHSSSSGRVSTSRVPEPVEGPACPRRTFL